MSIETRNTKDGLIFSIRYRDSEGRQHRETLGLKSEGWDRRKAKEEERKRIVQSQPNKSPLTFKEVAELWFQETAPRAKWKPRTKAAYLRSINRLEHFHDMKIGEIKPRHVLEFIKERS
jgi:hypothetical protein